MPVVVGNPPAIRSPGIGPNGPGALDMRQPVVPTKYGAAGGPIVNANGIWGILGPPADALQRPTAWYIRSGGSNNNGGTSTSLAADRTGTDGVANGTTTFTSATAAFTSADVGKGICINTGASAKRYRIAAFTNATTITLDRTSSSASSLTWAIGGAWADWRAAFGDAAVTGAADLNSPVRPGDTVYMGAQTQRVVLAMGTNFLPAYNGIINIVGDVTGQFTGDAGMVAVSAYVTNDKTAPSATTLLGSAGASRHGLAFSNIFFVGGTGAVVSTALAGCQNWTFRDCAIIQGGTGAAAGLIAFQSAFATPLNLLIDRCDIYATRAAGGVPLSLTCTTGAAGNDYDAFVSVTNSRIWADSAAFFVTNSGTLTFKGNGLHVRNCTFFGPVFTMSASQLSTIFPSTITGCFMYVGSAAAALIAGTSGQLTEDYNLIVASTPRTLVTAGAHSISDGSYAPLFHFGQERIWLPPLYRPFGEPMAGSPLLGFGGDGSATPYDQRGLTNPRPAGGSSSLPAVGALERADTFVADPAPIGAGGSPVKLTGPGYNDFLLPIQASQVNAARTVSVKVKWDANYVGILPEIEMIAKPQMGVSGQTVAAVGTAGNVITITLAPFTPTAVGVLNIRLLSLDLSGASVVEWDDFTIV